MIVRKTALSICLLAILAVFGAVASGQTVIEVWHSMPAGAATEIWNKIVADFNEKHPDIHVDDIHVGSYTAGFEKAQVAWAGGSPPNIAMLEQARNTVFI